MENYTKVPNEILDEMANLTPAAFKLLLALTRLTYGYHRTSVRVSLSELQTRTGLSRQGVVNAGKQIEAYFLHAGGEWVVNSVDQEEPQLVNSVDRTSQLSRPDRSTELTALVNSVDRTSQLSRPITSGLKKILKKDLNKDQKKRERKALSHFLASNNIALPATEEHWELVSHPAAIVWMQVTNRFPGWSNLTFVVDGLGDSPNITALERAWQIWLAHGYKNSNIAGIIDWHKELAADPNWQPYTRSKQNGRHKPLSDAPKQPDITAEDIEWARQALATGGNA